MNTILKWGAALSILAVAIIFLLSRSSSKVHSVDESLKSNPHKVVKVIRQHGG